MSAVDRACDALSHAQLAVRAAGRLGNEAPHNLLCAVGYEIDVHVSLPTVPPRGDAVRDVLRDLGVLDLGIGTVRVLNESGRCLVVALQVAAARPRPEISGQFSL